MLSERWDTATALKHVRSIRPIVLPNKTFLFQLKLFEDTKYEHPHTRRKGHAADPLLHSYSFSSSYLFPASVLLCLFSSIIPVFLPSFDVDIDTKG